MKNQEPDVGREFLSRLPTYRRLAGSVTGAILIYAIERHFIARPDGFFRFQAPAPNNWSYTVGNSWIEELGLSKGEFRTAFDGIGIRYKSKTAFEQAGRSPFVRPDGSEAMYASYTDHRAGLTYYSRNHALVDRYLEQVSRP